MKEFFSRQVEFLARNRVAFLLGVIVLVGAFLRLYHFSDWLHFELDQARDAKVIDAAINQGAGALPLLGPRAGGTFLRLGPGFYGMQYIGALVFGSSPRGIAMPIALFSVAAIPIFFFFVRRVFATDLALGLTGLFSVSVFLVLYGRFAWNPNALPFFFIAGFFALLKAVDIQERRPGRWLALSAFSLVFATHLHFLAFVAIPAIVFVFLAIKRPRFSWRAWLAVFGIVLALYIPVILNDTMTGGAEVKEFLEAVQGKSNKSKHTLVEQTVRNVTNHAAGFWVVLTGYEESAMGTLTSTSSVTAKLTCDDACHTHLLSATLAMLVFLTGVLLLLRRLWTEKNQMAKDTLLLSALWFFLCFFLFLPLSYDFSPRFFLLIAPFPFVFLGLALDALRQSSCPIFSKCSKVAPKVAAVVLSGFFVSNMYFLHDRFTQLAKAPFENFSTLPDRILKEKTRFTFKQEQMVLDFMQSFQRENGFPIYMFSEPEYRRALKYLMGRRGMRNDVLGYTNGIYEKGNYFLILRSGSNHENRLKKYRVSYEVAEEKRIGTITVFRFLPKPEAITDDAQVFDDTPKKSSSAPGVPERYTWSEWWNHRSGTTVEDAEDADEEQVSEE